ncbi:MAG: S41 family peptidase [Clostridia bacterium]|nr:S41 family peptidase [Clostridia bacterium]
MQKGKRVLQLLILIAIIISFTVTGILGLTVATNYNNLGRLIQVGVLIKSEFLWPVENKDLIDGAIEGMVQSLEDRYSEYLDREEFLKLQGHIQGSFGGLGIYVGMRDGKITVVAPIEGSPGERAGIKSGDVIVSINGRSTENMSMDEAVDQMKGEPGTEVTVALKRAEVDTPIELTIVREIINVQTVAGQILEENPHVGYIRIAMFASNTDEAFTEELGKLREQGIKGLIIDLRNNPGGDLNSVVNIAQHFLPKGPVVHIVDNKGNKNTLSTPGTNFEIPLVVLINEGSASASEILAGAVQDTQVGILVGNTTFGKGIVQNVYFLSDGAGLKLTTAKYLTPNERDIHGKGVKPDIEVNLPVFVSGQEEFIEDTQFIEALRLIEEKI